MKFAMKQALDRFIGMTLCWLSYTRFLDLAILEVQRFTSSRKGMGRKQEGGGSNFANSLHFYFMCLCFMFVCVGSAVHYATQGALGLELQATVSHYVGAEN